MSSAPGGEHLGGRSARTRAGLDGGKLVRVGGHNWLMSQVVLTGALLALALVLFARALMAVWPCVVAEMPKHPCGFMPPA